MYLLNSVAGIYLVTNFLRLWLLTRLVTFAFSLLFSLTTFFTLHVQPGVNHWSCQQRWMQWNLWHGTRSIYFTPDGAMQSSEWPNPKVLNIYDAQISWLFLIHPDCKELLWISIKWEKYTMKELSLNLLGSFQPEMLRGNLKTQL